MSEIGIQGSVKASHSPVVSFSARNLLMFHNPSFFDFCAQYFKSNSIDIDSKRLRKAFIQSVSDLNLEMSKQSLIDRDESFMSKRLVSHLELSERVDPKKLDEGFRLTSRLVVPESTFDLLEALKERAYKLAILSNDGPELVEFLKVSGLIRYFETVLIAPDVGALKPDPVFFQTLSEELEIQASELTHVGSNYSRDVLFSNAVGVKALLYDPKDIEREALQLTELEPKQSSSKVVSISSARNQSFQAFKKLDELLNYFQ